MGAPQYEQAGADIAGGGTAGTLAVWTTGSTLGNSGITDNGTTVSFVSRNLASTAAQTWTLASSTTALNIASGLLNLDTTNARVGIGTASPAFKLEVAAGAASAMRLVSDSGTATVLRLLQTANRDWGIRIPASSTSLSFYDYSAAAERMVIDLNGNVGIGTTSPVSRLDVAGTITCDDAGTGLKLPATPGNADVQTLDCYQENPLATTAGNGWTPTLSAAATWGGTLPTVVWARYLRIGSLVFVTIKLNGVAISSTYGSTTIDLPVAPNANCNEGSVPVSSSTGAVQGVGAVIGSTIYLPTLAATTVFRMTFCYFA